MKLDRICKQDLRKDGREAERGRRERSEKERRRDRTSQWERERLRERGGGGGGRNSRRQRCNERRKWSDRYGKVRVDVIKWWSYT